MRTAATEIASPIGKSIYVEGPPAEVLVNPELRYTYRERIEFKSDSPLHQGKDVYYVVERRSRADDPKNVDETVFYRKGQLIEGGAIRPHWAVVVDTEFVLLLVQKISEAAQAGDKGEVRGTTLVGPELAAVSGNPRYAGQDLRYEAKRVRSQEKEGDDSPGYDVVVLSARDFSDSTIDSIRRTDHPSHFQVEIDTKAFVDMAVMINADAGKLAP